MGRETSEEARETRNITFLRGIWQWPEKRERERESAQVSELLGPLEEGRNRIPSPCPSLSPDRAARSLARTERTDIFEASEIHYPCSASPDVLAYMHAEGGQVQ